MGVVGSITPETAFISNLGKFVTVTDVAKAMQKAIDDLKVRELFFPQKYNELSWPELQLTHTSGYLQNTSYN